MGLGSDKKLITVMDLSGGRNGNDFPLNIPDNQCREALNMDFWASRMGTKRWGASALGVTFGAGGPFAGVIGSLHRFVPAADETAAELWAIDRGAVNRFGRLAGGTTWAEATLVDNLAAATDASDVTSATLNGRLYFCYKNTSSLNRSYVWDPANAMVRRAGLATPTNAPTVAAMGAGGLTWTRFYRTRRTDVSGTDTRRRSEASATVSITIAAKLGATVTKDAAYTASEQDTNWEIEAADAAAGPWYLIATVAVGTGTYDDTNATIPTTTPSPLDGINRPPPAARFVIATDARLIYAGLQSNVTTLTPVRGRTHAIYVTPVIGDNDVGDSERIPLGSVYTVDAPITGIGGPLDGAFYVFSYRRIWKFVPTGNPADPYARYSISTSVGCIRHQSIVQAEDENGNPCLYFLSVRGPYRLGSNGLQFLGEDITDQWIRINLGGTCHAIYFGDKYQVWFYASTGATAYTDLKFKFDTRNGRPAENSGQVRQGWNLDDGTSAEAFASVMFSASVAASMGLALKPYVAQNATAAIWKCDADGVVQDVGTSYNSRIITKEFAPAGLSANLEVLEPSVVYATSRTNQAETFEARLGGDFFFDSAAQTPSTLVSKDVAFTSASFADAPFHTKIEGLTLGGIGSFGIRLGDKDVSQTSMFSLHSLSITYMVREPR